MLEEISGNISSKKSIGICQIDYKLYPYSKAKEELEVWSSFDVV